MEKQEIRTFGRRHGKRISARQQWLVDNLLSQISPKSLDNNTTNILEIGFGGGEHLRDLAIGNPNSVVIGAEPFMNGVASTLSAITNESDNSVKLEYQNLRIWADDVRQILSPNSPNFISVYFAQIYVLHPDPWPKARHEKRRLLNADFLALLASRLTIDGEIIIGTDHWEYYDWILEQIKSTDLKIKNIDMKIIETRYQQKNKAGTTAPKYLVLGN